MKAKRYALKRFQRNPAKMMRCESGDYILYTDYATLEAQAERLREALLGMVNACASGDKFQIMIKLIPALMSAQIALSTLENETAEEVK